MADEKNKSKEDIMKFALDELKKTIECLKQGKNPMASPELKKIIQMLNQGHTMVEEKKISEDDMDSVLKEAAKKATKNTETK